MKKTIILIPILLVLGFSLLSAQQKKGVFVGVSPFHSGNFAVVEESICMGCTFTSTGTNQHSNTETESFGSGLGLKVGYNFPNWRVSYNNLTWNLKDDFDGIKIKNSLVIANYVFNSGFYLGVGFGTGTIENNNTGFSESGSAFGYNLGYDWNISESFQVGLGYLLSGFGYSNTTSAGDVKSDFGIGIATLFIDLTYRF